MISSAVAAFSFLLNVPNVLLSEAIIKAIVYLTVGSTLVIFCQGTLRNKQFRNTFLCVMGSFGVEHD